MTEPQAPLYGREQLLSRIYRDITTGQTRYGIEGISGIGKSALLENICDNYKRYGFDGVARINAAQVGREDIAIAQIYLQLRRVASDPRSLASRIREKFSKDLPGALKSIGAAVVADLLSLATDKAEHTIDALESIAKGNDSTPTVESQLKAMEKDNRRFFLDNFLCALATHVYHVVIAIDNFDQADTSLVALVRNLVLRKPDAVAILLVHNIEIGENERWDHVTADIKAKAGEILVVEPLTQSSMENWFEASIGRRPTACEVHALIKDTGGRPSKIAPYLQAIAQGVVPRRVPSFTGYYELQRKKLTPDGRTVGDLLSVINRDAMVPLDMLAQAARELGVENVGPPLEELKTSRLVKQEGKLVALSHSDVHRFWSETTDNVRRNQLGRAWISVVSDFSVEQLVGAYVLPLLPVIMQQRTTDAPEIGARLIELGQTTAGLQIVDSLLAVDLAKESTSMDPHGQALLSAKTRLDLGRYREVDEPLRMAELAAGDDTVAREQVLLVRMKLALRTNAYPALAAIAQQLQNSSDIKVRIESELLRNVVYRDRMDEPSIRESVSRLRTLRSAATPDETNSIDRALARSLAKLGQNEEALVCATNALASAQTLNSIRALGNSQLALAEVHRYRRESSASEHYGLAASIARSTGNRDSLLWALLGEAAFFIESSQSQRAVESMVNIKSLLDEPGYEHPLESTHHSLLDFLISGDARKVESVVAAYTKLNIEWPQQFIQSFLSKREIPSVIPL